MIKLGKRIGYFLGLLLFGILLYAHTLLGVNPEWMWQRKFSEELRPLPFKIKLESRTLYGVDTGEVSKTPLMMVHGSPGSWTGWETYFKDLKLREKYRLMAVDRPGFGFSGIGKPERSLAQQAAAIAAALPKGEKSVLMGHSYGGPVVVRMAIDYPDQVAAIVVLAGSVAPDLEETMWIQRLAHSPLLRWLVPAFAYSTNEEILALKASLETMKTEWDKINVPVIIIHGEDDTLVPVENVDYMEAKLIKAEKVEVIRIPNGNHFIPWEYYSKVVKELDRLSETQK